VNPEEKHRELCVIVLEQASQVCTQEDEFRGGTHTPFADSSKRGDRQTRILRKGLVKIPSAVGSAKEARRLRSCSEVKLRRITSRRIIVGLTVSRSIRQKLRWG
jgi:hypothetical protein